MSSPLALHEFLMADRICERSNCLIEHPYTRLLQPEEHDYPDSQLFCLDALLGALASLLTSRYELFDAHTTTRCCHGIALLATDLIDIARDIDLPLLISKVQQERERLLHADRSCSEFGSALRVPLVLIELAGLYILQCVAARDAELMRKVDIKRLRLITVGKRRFMDKSVKYLQTRLSNLVALRWQSIASKLPTYVSSCGVSVSEWCNYVGDNSIRVDRFKRMYSPCIFTMQVLLCDAIYHRRKVGVMCDVYNQEGRRQELITHVLTGNGKNGFDPVLNAEPAQEKNGGIIVFRGYHRNSCSHTSAESTLLQWIHRLDELILANDIHYPQYPSGGIDVNFDSSPIITQSESIKGALCRLAAVPGVRREDPSTFCLSHIFPASLNQIKSLQAGRPVLLEGCPHPLGIYLCKNPSTATQPVKTSIKR